MLRFNAVQSGGLVTDFRSGSLFSLHEGFVNIALRQNIVSILDDPGQIHGFGILVGSGCIESLHAKLRHDSAVPISLKAFALAVGEVVIDLTHSRIYDGTVKRCGLRGPAAEVASIMGGAISRFLVSNPDRYVSSGDTFLRHERRILSLASEGAGDISGIIGVGRGLTPAGDDCIAGALLAEDLFSRGGRIDRVAIQDNLDRTNLPGRTLLEAALLGSYPSHAVRLAAALCDTSTDLGAVTIDTLKFGASSGYDLCRGVLWCIAAYGN